MLIADCSMVDVIGSIVISLSPAVVASQMMRGQTLPQIFFLEPPLAELRSFMSFIL